jgi:imidazolonepropionase-like amidohydrolase
MVKALYDNHIPIVAGTDAMAGFSLHRELELYVQAGIPSAEVLRIATLGAASVMKHDDQLGSIAPGKLADLDIVDGDPSVNISDVRRVVTVIKDGKIFDARAVAEEIGVK